MFCWDTSGRFPLNSADDTVTFTNLSVYDRHIDTPTRYRMLPTILLCHAVCYSSAEADLLGSAAAKQASAG